jgi:hypothetical protein
MLIDPSFRLWRRRRTLIGSLLLAALFFRAYVPPGFMPASGSPFQVEVCPAAMHMAMPMHHEHESPGGHAGTEDCPFGSSPAPGPVSHVQLFKAPTSIVSAYPFAIERGRPGVRSLRTHQPRAPPSLV